MSNCPKCGARPVSYGRWGCGTSSDFGGVIHSTNCQTVTQLTTERDELRSYIRSEYDRYETFHPHADAMRKRFPWLR